MRGGAKGNAKGQIIAKYPVADEMLPAKNTLARGNQKFVIRKLNNELPNVNWTQSRYASHGYSAVESE